MADKKPELGEIKTPSVMIIPVTQDYQYKEGDFKPGTTKFFFNYKDTGFISFSHAIGWSKDALSEVRLEVVDPGADFEKEFVAGHYFNRSANSDIISRSYYITYGIGKDTDIIQWSPPQLAYLIKIDVIIRSDGTRKYELLFGSLPSLRNKPSAHGWPLIDQSGRVLLTAGKAGFSNQDVTKMFIQADEEAIITYGDSAVWPLMNPQRNLEAGRGGERHALYDAKGINPGSSKDAPILRDLGGWDRVRWRRIRRAPYTHGGTDLGSKRKAVAEDWINFLDEATYVCIKRYIENITGLGPKINKNGKLGNVIVLLPSFKHTAVMQRMHQVLSGDKLVGALAAKSPRGVDWMISPRHNPAYLINNYLFKNFSNLQAFNEFDAKIIDHPTHRKLFQKNKPRASDDGFLIFQANNNDFIKKQRGGIAVDTKIDWLKVLTTFGEQFTEELNKVNVYFRQMHNFWGHSFAGSFDYKEIRDAKRLQILKDHGLIERTDDYCFIWGDTYMTKFLLGQVKKTEAGFVDIPSYNEVIKAMPNKSFRMARDLFPTGMINQGFITPTMEWIGMDDTTVLSNLGGDLKSTKARQTWVDHDKAMDDTTVLSNLGDVWNFVQEDKNLKEIGDHNFYKTLKDMDDDAILKVKNEIESHMTDSTAWVAEIGDNNFVPILRSNVKNPNVLDLRLQMNPHYWGALAGTVDTLIPEFNKRERSTPSFRLFRKGDTVLEGYLKAAGFMPDDPIWLKWTDSIREHLGVWVKKWEEAGIVPRKTMIIDSIEYTLEDVGLLPLKRGSNMGWEKDGEGGSPDELPNTLIMKHIFSNFFNFDFGKNYEVFSPPREIFVKNKKKFGMQDLFLSTRYFYEQLYKKAGPQLDVTTYPMFLYSRHTDIGQPMWVLTKQPSILEGINPEADTLALNKEIKSQYSNLGSGLYFIEAFNHTIRNDRVQSRFRLIKRPYAYDEGLSKELKKQKPLPYLDPGSGSYGDERGTALERYYNSFLPEGYGKPAKGGTGPGHGRQIYINYRSKKGP